MTLDELIEYLKEDVPCYSHTRRVNRRISLTKGPMKWQIAAVGGRPTQDSFLIDVKASLLNSWCFKHGKRVPGAFGPTVDGLYIEVQHTSSRSSDDYLLSVKILQDARRSPLLPPC